MAGLSIPRGVKEERKKQSVEHAGNMRRKTKALKTTKKLGKRKHR